MIPTANSNFSGAGGLDIGVMEAGVEVVQSLDLDKEATDCMLMNPKYFSHPVLRRDIKHETVLDKKEANIHLFTYPCTEYAEIADLHGSRSGDDLFLHAFRHVVLGKPDAFVVENVPGMKKFPVVMEAMSQIPGYYVTVLCPLDASLWLPQRRERLIMIGTKKPFSITAPSNLIRKKTLKSILEKDPVYDMPDYVISRIEGKYRDKPIVSDPDNPNELAPTCVAHYSKDLGTRLVKDPSTKYGVRPYSIREYARLQGFPDDYKFPKTRSAYRLIGNAVPVDMGIWIGQQLIKYFN